MSGLIKKRLLSFAYAFQGLWTFVSTQPHAWVHTMATVVTFSAATYFEISAYEWLAIILVIGLVWVAEALNTAIEFACDAITLEHHPKIKHAKDIAAAAVLLAAFTSLAVAGVIFWPYLRDIASG